MGIEGGLPKVIAGDDWPQYANACLTTLPDEIAQRAHTFIVDATATLQGSVITQPAGTPFSRCANSLNAVFMSAVARYPAVTALVAIVDTFSRVPAPKSMEHADRGRRALDETELRAHGLLQERIDLEELERNPGLEATHWNICDAFPLHMALPEGIPWSRLWHTRPTRRAMEAAMRDVIVRAAQQGAVPDTHWLRTWQLDPHEMLWMPMGSSALPSCVVASRQDNIYISGSVAAYARAHAQSPLLFADTISREHVDLDLYAEADVCVGADPMTGAPEMRRMLCPVAASDAAGFQPLCVVAATGVPVDDASIAGIVQSTAGEFDVKCLNYIRPEFGDTFILYSDDSDLIPILLLYLLRVDMARHGWPIHERDRALSSPTQRWFPRHVIIDRTANAELRNNATAPTRFIDMTKLYDALRHCLRPVEWDVLSQTTTPQQRGKECKEYCAKIAARITAAVLGIVLCGTDFASRMSHCAIRTLYGKKDDDADPEPSGPRRARPNVEHVLSTKTCWDAAVRRMGMRIAVGVRPLELRRIMNVVIDPVALIYAILDEYARYAKEQRGVTLVAAIPALTFEARCWNGTEERQKELTRAWNLLFAHIARPELKQVNGKRLVAMPPLEVARANCARIQWNLEYWARGALVSQAHLDSRFGPVQTCDGVSQCGWRVQRVPPERHNPLDLSQHMWPLPQAPVEHLPVWPPTDIAPSLSGQPHVDLSTPWSLWEVERAETLMPNGE